MSNWSSNGYIDPDAPFAQAKGGTGRRLTRHFIREMAKSDSSNRATCEICHKTYGASYVKLVRFSFMKIGHCCADCRRDGRYELA